MDPGARYVTEVTLDPGARDVTDVTMDAGDLLWILEQGISQKLLWILGSYYRFWGVYGPWGVTMDPGELLWILGLGM